MTPLEISISLLGGLLAGVILSILLNKYARTNILAESIPIKTEKKASKQNVDITSNLYLENPTIRPTNFSELVESITKNNTLRSYPDVNDIPN